MMDDICVINLLKDDCNLESYSFEELYMNHNFFLCNLNNFILCVILGISLISLQLASDISFSTFPTFHFKRSMYNNY